MTSEQVWASLSKEQHPCLLWTRARRGPYGRAWDSERKRYIDAHRWAYELVCGPIAPGEVVMHTCDVPLCCNPNHLRAGTQAQNLADCARKRRNARGESHGSSKLSEADVREILRAVGVTQRALARRYGVSEAIISLIVNRKRWVA
jgi:plasmid stability protein